MLRRQRGVWPGSVAWRKLAGWRWGVACAISLWLAPLGLSAHAEPRSHVPLTVIDDRHHTITLAHPPQRIITLLPSLSESLCALGACDRLVATDRYADWPERVRALPKVGGIDDTPLETVLRLHPDVVLAAQSSRAISRLEELGVTVIALEPKTFDDMHRVLAILSDLIGDPGRGETEWRQMTERIAAAAARIPTSLQGQSVYFEVSDAPHAASTSSFVGELLARLTLHSVVSGRLGPFPQINPELVLREDPTIVMSSDEELGRMTSRPGWNQLRAFRTHRTCGFTRAQWDLMVRPGPRLAEAADVIAQCVAALPHE